MAETADHIGYDAKAWIDRLVYLAATSKFTASERALLVQRLGEIRKDLTKPIPFVEASHAR